MNFLLAGALLGVGIYGRGETKIIGKENVIDASENIASIIKEMTGNKEYIKQSNIKTTTEENKTETINTESKLESLFKTETEEAEKKAELLKLNPFKPEAYAKQIEQEAETYNSLQNLQKDLESGNFQGLIDQYTQNFEKLVQGENSEPKSETEKLEQELANAQIQKLVQDSKAAVEELSEEEKEQYKQVMGQASTLLKQLIGTQPETKIEDVEKLYNENIEKIVEQKERQEKYVAEMEAAIKKAEEEAKKAEEEAKIEEQKVREDIEKNIAELTRIQNMNAEEYSVYVNEKVAEYTKTLDEEAAEELKYYQENNKLTEEDKQNTIEFLEMSLPKSNDDLSKIFEGQELDEETKTAFLKALTPKTEEELAEQDDARIKELKALKDIDEEEYKQQEIEKISEMWTKMGAEKEEIAKLVEQMSQHIAKPSVEEITKDIENIEAAREYRQQMKKESEEAEIETKAQIEELKKMTLEEYQNKATEEYKNMLDESDKASVAAYKEMISTKPESKALEQEIEFLNSVKPKTEEEIKAEEEKARVEINSAIEKVEGLKDEKTFESMMTEQLETPEIKTIVENIQNFLNSEAKTEEDKIDLVAELKKNTPEKQAALEHVLELLNAVKPKTDEEIKAEEKEYEIQYQNALREQLKAIKTE